MNLKYQLLITNESFGQALILWLAVVRYWTTIKYSGAFPAAEVNQMLARVEKLREAVKFAREKANTIQVIQQDAGDRITAYLSGISYTPNRVQA